MLSSRIRLIVTLTLVSAAMLWSRPVSAQIDEWEVPIAETEDPLSPRIARTPTVALPATDLGLALGSREIGEATTGTLSVGLRLGPRIIQGQIYLSLVPEVALDLGPLQVSLHVPLNLLLLEPGTNKFGGFALRGRDWDEATDFIRILHSLSLSLSSYRLLVDSGSPRTLARGHLVNAYQPSIDLDRPSTGVALRMNDERGSFDIMIADVTFERAVIGGAGFVRPFAIAGVANPILRSLGFGVEVASDLHAPACVRPSELEERCVSAQGNRSGFDPDTGELLDDTYVATSREDGLPFVSRTQVVGLGGSIFMDLYRSSELLVEAHTSWDMLVGGGHGVSVGVGVAGSQYRGVRAEVRLLTNQFIFGYFGTLYEVEKIESLSYAETSEIAPTKHQAVFGDPSAQVDAVASGLTGGFRVAATWQFFPYTPLTLSLGLEESGRHADTQIYLHADFRTQDRLHMFATILRLGADGFAHLGDLDQGGLVLLGGARVRIYRAFLLRASYAYLQVLSHAPGAELHLGDRKVAELDLRRDRVFEAAHTVLFELEIAWSVL